MRRCNCTASFLYDFVFYEFLCLFDCFCRALSCASAAVDASICVDNILAVAFADCISRALSCTCTTHYTIITNNICHSFFPPYNLPFTWRK